MVVIMVATRHNHDEMRREEGTARKKRVPISIKEKEGTEEKEKSPRHEGRHCSERSVVRSDRNGAREINSLTRAPFLFFCLLFLLCLGESVFSLCWPPLRQILYSSCSVVCSVFVLNIGNDGFSSCRAACLCVCVCAFRRCKIGKCEVLPYYTPRCRNGDIAMRYLEGWQKQKK